MSDWAFASATELAAAIQRKEASSLELTELYIGRIEKYDGALNAVVVRDFDRARVAARTADAALDRGESLGPLTPKRTPSSCAKSEFAITIRDSI